MSQASSAKPVQCGECSELMSSPLCCSECGTLNPLPPSMFTYFELFSIPQQYDIDVDDLRRRYLNLSRSIHPDVAGRSSSDVHRQSLALSAGLNRAYETLRDPVVRAEYLLQLARGPAASDDKNVPASLLGEVMMLREEIDEAVGSSDSAALATLATLATLAQTLKHRHETTLDAIANICRKENLADQNVQKQLRQQLNAIKYWSNLMEKIPTVDEA